MEKTAVKRNSFLSRRDVDMTEGNVYALLHHAAQRRIMKNSSYPRHGDPGRHAFV